MADVITTAGTIIFLGILLLVGVVVFATVADPMSDQFHSREIVIAAETCTNLTADSGGSPLNTTYNMSVCTGTINYPPIENGTRAAPIVYNCSSALGLGGTCQTMTTAFYNFSQGIGIFHILDDIYNGTIMVDYWEDNWADSVDRAQQSITGTVYGGFDLATVMVIVMAAVGIVSTIFLIGRRGA